MAQSMEDARSFPRLVLTGPSQRDASGCPSAVVSPLDGQQQAPFWPTLSSVLPAELAARMANAEEDDSEDNDHDKKLRMAAHFGQILLERHDKQEQKIQSLQTFIEDMLEQNQVLSQDVAASRDSCRVLEAERDFLEAALTEVECQQSEQAAARVTSDVREAGLLRRVRDLSSQCEEQEIELASLRSRPKQQRTCYRCSDADPHDPLTLRQSPTNGGGGSDGGGGNVEEGTEEDAWTQVTTLRSRLKEQAQATQDREQGLLQELAQAEAERSAVQSKLQATQNAVRNAFRRRVPGSEADDGDDDGDGDFEREGVAAFEVPDAAPMQSLPAARHTVALARSRSHVGARGGERTDLVRRLFSDASAESPGCAAAEQPGGGVSLWSEVSEQNQGLQHRYERLLRSFHSSHADALVSPTSATGGSYSGLFEDLFGMLRKLKARLVTDLTAKSDSPLDLSTEVLMPM